MKRNYKSKSIKSILENFVEQENLVDGIFNIKIKDVLSFVLITLIPFTATKYVNENLI